MSITVDIEDLKKFEAICRDWWNRRTLHFTRHMTKESFNGGFSEVIRENIGEMKKWDAENPFPKLIPNV